MGLFKKNKNIDRKDIVVYTENGSELVKEQYNRLKDNILYSAIDGNIKVIQIESSISGEGKTSTLSNLAIVLGKDGKKVCVVDLDFRKPRLHRTFRIENFDGIADYMLDKIDYNKMIKKTAFDNVDIINRGTEVDNASIILTSDKMKNLIETLKSTYDFILLDCPPVLIISDYIHISKFSDTVVFVCAYGKTKRKQVQEALKQLRQNNIQVLGTVLTFYDPKKSTDSYEYTGYYGYMDKYYHKDTEETK